MKKSTPLFISLLLYFLCFFEIKAQKSELEKYELKNIQTDWDKTLEIAQKQDKNILLVFTGSDWCKPCIQMKKKVFSKKIFVEFVEKNFIVCVFDMPNHWIYGSELVNNYQKLSTQYNAPAFPSLVITDKKGVLKSKILKKTTDLNFVMQELEKNAI